METSGCKTKSSTFVRTGKNRKGSNSLAWRFLGEISIAPMPCPENAFLRTDPKDRPSPFPRPNDKVGNLRDLSAIRRTIFTFHTLHFWGECLHLGLNPRSQECVYPVGSARALHLGIEDTRTNPKISPISGFRRYDTTRELEDWRPDTCSLNHVWLSMKKIFRVTVFVPKCPLTTYCSCNHSCTNGMSNNCTASLSWWLELCLLTKRTVL